MTGNERLGGLRGLASRFGVAVPELGVVVSRAEPFLEVAGFTAPGGAAVEWWCRLADVGSQLGYWPVLFRSRGPYSDGTADSLRWLWDKEAARAAEDVLADAAALNGAALVAPRTMPSDGSGPDWLPEVLADLGDLEDWPVPAVPPPTAQDVIGSADVSVALVPVAQSWQVPAVLGLAGWNAFPAPAEHCAILRYWHQQFGAELLMLGSDQLALRLRRPPAAKPEAVRLAVEYQDYCDGLFDCYRAGDTIELAAALLGNGILHAWWD